MTYDPLQRQGDRRRAVKRGSRALPAQGQRLRRWLLRLQSGTCTIIVPSDGRDSALSQYRLARADTYRTALGITVSAGALVLALCRKLIESGTYGSSIPLDAYRGATLCLRLRSIGEVAQMNINGNTRLVSDGPAERRTLP